MALFSLLVAILVERLKLLPSAIQLDRVLKTYHKLLFGDHQLQSPFMMSVALVFPAVTVAVFCWVLSGLLWGLLSLVFWVFMAILCFTHQQQRHIFKKYVQAACRKDNQACFHHATEFDPSEDFDVVTGAQLGCKVGQSVAWANYRYYGAVALLFIVFGPIGAIFYCTVRYYADRNQVEEKNWPIVKQLFFILDWLPSRIFSFGYVLCGEFRHAIETWRKLALQPRSSARDIIVKTAMAAEPLSEETTDDISLDPTIAMLALSKRNFILMVTLVSLLTIFGMIS